MLTAEHKKIIVIVIIIVVVILVLLLILIIVSKIVGINDIKLFAGSRNDDIISEINYLLGK